MGTIFREKATKIRVLQSEKTSYPVLRYLAPGTTGDDIKQGELVGIRPTASMQIVAEKITQSNQYDQAVNALMRINNTTHDVQESGGITCLEGLYLLQTQVYLPGTYTVGQALTLRFSDDVNGGAWGPVDGSTKHVLAQVVVAPQNGTKQTPMVIKVYPQPIATN